MDPLEELFVPSSSQQRMKTLRRLLSLPEEISVFYAFGAPQDVASVEAGPRSKILLHDSRLAPWWQEYQQDRNRYREDPVRHQLRRSMGPIAWNTLVPGGQIERADDDLWKHVRGHGIRSGLSIPLRDPQRRLHGSLAFIGFCEPTLFDEWWHDMSQDAIGAAHLFHQGLIEVKDCSEKSKLSPREKQCLKFVACGMTSKEIARELGLSPRTVDLHVARGVKRLRAANRTEAAMLAIRIGQLD